MYTPINTPYASLLQFPDMMSQSIVVSLEGCPPGRSLGAIHGEGVFECDCDRDNANILSCEPNGYDVVLKVSIVVR